MKNIFRLLTLAICAITLTLNQACSKDDENPDKELIVITARVSNILVKNAVCGGEITSKGNSGIIESGVLVSTSPNPAFNKINTSAWPNTSEANPFSIEVDKLRPNTEYYVRAYATTDEAVTYGNQEVFTTMANPEITTGDIFYISGRGLVVTCNIASDGGLAIKERGIVYGTSENPTVENNVLTDVVGGTGEYSIEIKGILTKTPHYFRAYAKNDGGVFYGNQKTYSGK